MKPVAWSKIVDCGFLAEKTGYYMVGPFGIADPAKTDNLIEHSSKIIEDGYISIDSEGNSLKPLDDALRHDRCRVS